MSRAFADTSFYIAIASPADALHGVALAEGDKCADGIVTTEHVLTELGNYFSAKNRPIFCEMLELVEADVRTHIVPASAALFCRATPRHFHPCGVEELGRKRTWGRIAALCNLH